MSDQPAEEAHRTGRSVRLDTLVRLRWLAVIGQSTAVLVVYFGLDYELPIWPCLAVIALAAWLNIALRIRFPLTSRPTTLPWASSNRVVGSISIPSCSVISTRDRPSIRV